MLAAKRLLGCLDAIAQRSKSWAYGQETKRHGPDKLGDGDGAGHGAGVADSYFTPVGMEGCNEATESVESVERGGREERLEAKKAATPFLWRRDVVAGQSATPRSSALQGASSAGNIIQSGITIAGSILDNALDWSRRS